jgi:hypothetical protein
MLTFSLKIYLNVLVPTVTVAIGISDLKHWIRAVAEVYSAMDVIGV